MKTYIKFTFFLLFINTAFAQLTVRNNAYIFATDEVVFVEDDVSLKEANSMFYLRDDAQLVQGAGNTGNSGVGQLSVFQSGTVHQWGYNYWASPVGNTDADAFGNSQYRADNNMYDFTGGSGNPIGSSLASFTSGLNGVSSPLSISNRWLFSYDRGTEYTDWDYLGSDGDLDTGYGYSMKGTAGSSGQLYDFRGKPNSGDIPTAVSTGKITLVGNPYPSALDVAAYIHDPVNSTRMTGILQFWAHDLTVNSHFVADYEGGYASLTMAADGSMRSFIKARFDTYNQDGTFSSAGSTTTSPKELFRHLPIGQGFMIEGTADGDVFFRDSQRDYNTNFTTLSSTVFRTNPNVVSSENKDNATENDFDENGVFIIPDDYKRFRLYVDFNDTYSNELLLNFHESATEGFDYGLEIIKPLVETAEVYFKNPNDEHLVVAQAHKFNKDLRIPLYVDLTQQKSIRVRIEDIQNFSDGEEIYLHDIASDIYYDLREMNFETISSARRQGENGTKYEITFRDFNNLDENTVLKIDNFSVHLNNNSSKLIVLNRDNLTINEISLYDVLGNRIMQNKKLNSESRYEFSTTNLSDGTYVVKVDIAKENSKLMSKKIIVRRKN